MIAPARPPSVLCTCHKAWHSVLPPPPCPVHGAAVMQGWPPPNPTTLPDPLFTDLVRRELAARFAKRGDAMRPEDV